MENKVHKKISIGRVFFHIFLIIGSLSFILPLILLVSISISSKSSIAHFGYQFIPAEVTFDAYKQIFRNPKSILQAYKITIAFSALSTALGMLVQSMISYTLSRNTYRFKKFLTWFIFFTMLFSGGLVPTYLLITKYLHLNNTFWVYIFPSLVSAWNIIILRTFVKGLPDGLIEAAKIDGASEYMIFFRIILPLMVPAIASLGFMGFIAKWNDWNTTLLYIKDQDLYSLQYLLQRMIQEVEFAKKMAKTTSAINFKLENYSTESVRYAMAVIAAGPTLVLFPFFQKYFSKGLTLGSVKG